MRYVGKWLWVVFVHSCLALLLRWSTADAQGVSASAAACRTFRGRSAARQPFGHQPWGMQVVFLERSCNRLSSIGPGLTFEPIVVVWLLDITEATKTPRAPCAPHKKNRRHGKTDKCRLLKALLSVRTTNAKLG